MDLSISDFLRAEVDRTQNEYYRAKERFWNITKDLPSGLPHPDGMKRIQNARRDESAALDRYIHALRRLNDFVLDGVVPDELKDSRKKPVGSDPK